MTFSQKILFLLACSLLINNAFAEVYKWVDSAGKVQYGDQPPGTSQTKKLKVDKASTTAQSTTTEKAPVAKSVADQELDFRKRRVETEEAKKKLDKQANEAKQKQDNCNNARASLRGIQESGRIVKYTENGEKTFLDDAGRQQAMDRAQKDVDSWCK